MHSVCSSSKKDIIHHRFNFKPGGKLKSRKLIQHLFKAGKSFSIFPFRVIYIQPETSHTYLQAGFSVSSKNFKKAVERNKIKRLMREAYRLQKSILETGLGEAQSHLAVFIIYTGKVLPEFEDVSDKMGATLNRLEKIILK